MRGYRWRVACINWGAPDAPKAVAYVRDGPAIYDRYFTSWDEAVAWADKVARRTKK
jgi:hypothetical protein